MSSLSNQTTQPTTTPDATEASSQAAARDGSSGGPAATHMILDVVLGIVRDRTTDPALAMALTGTLQGLFAYYLLQDIPEVWGAPSERSRPSFIRQMGALTSAVMCMPTTRDPMEPIVKTVFESPTAQEAALIVSKVGASFVRFYVLPTLATRLLCSRPTSSGNTGIPASLPAESLPEETETHEECPSSNSRLRSRPKEGLAANSQKLDVVIPAPDINLVAQPLPPALFRAMSNQTTATIATTLQPPPSDRRVVFDDKIALRLVCSLWGQDTASALINPQSIGGNILTRLVGGGTGWAIGAFLPAVVSSVTDHEIRPDDVVTCLTGGTWSGWLLTRALAGTNNALAPAEPSKLLTFGYLTGALIGGSTAIVMQWWRYRHGTATETPLPSPVTSGRPWSRVTEDRVRTIFLTAIGAIDGYTAARARLSPMVPSLLLDAVSLLLGAGTGYSLATIAENTDTRTITARLKRGSIGAAAGSTTMALATRGFEIPLGTADLVSILGGAAVAAFLPELNDMDTEHAALDEFATEDRH